MKKDKRSKEEKAMSYFLPGLILVALALGSLFWISLLRFSFWIMLAVVAVLVYYLNESIMSYYRKKELSPFNIRAGFVALFLIVGFFGMQSPQLPFKPWFLGLGVILFLIGFFKLKG